MARSPARIGVRARGRYRVRQRSDRGSENVSGSENGSGAGSVRCVRLPPPMLPIPRLPPLFSPDMHRQRGFRLRTRQRIRARVRTRTQTRTHPRAREPRAQAALGMGKIVPVARGLPGETDERMGSSPVPEATGAGGELLGWSALAVPPRLPSPSSPMCVDNERPGIERAGILGRSPRLGGPLPRSLLHGLVAPLRAPHAARLLVSVRGGARGQRMGWAFRLWGLARAVWTTADDVRWSVRGWEEP